MYSALLLGQLSSTKAQPPQVSTKLSSTEVKLAGSFLYAFRFYITVSKVKGTGANISIILIQNQAIDYA
jgi:hypothetical protein